MMPHLTGMELYRQVRERHPRLADRFVFITGGIVHDDVRAFLAQVPNAQLEKPFSGIELREVTRRVLRRSGAGS
jgi:DNA-binding response OmpR family regulator